MQSIQTNQKKLDFNQHDLLKLIAIVTMILDHVGMYFLHQYTLLRVIGRMAAPIFFFLIGYTQSTRITLTLFNYGLFLTYCTYILRNKIYLNILLTFCLIRLIFKMTHIHKATHIHLLLVSIGLLGLYLLGVNQYVEYGITGSLFTITGIAMQQHKSNRLLLLLLSIIFYFIVMIKQFELLLFRKLVCILFLICCMFALLFLKFSPEANYPKLNFLRTISRNSLHIYFGHVTLFIFIYLYIAFHSA